MSRLKITTNPAVATVFAGYPAAVRPKLAYLRALILETAAQQPNITELEETLKWGEPSYLVKRGSTIRIDYKAKNPDQYAIYFKCTSKLVPTFKALFGDTFHYEKNRAIRFGLDDKVPVAALTTCIELALTYHMVKDLPLLGK